MSCSGAHLWIKTQIFPPLISLEAGLQISYLIFEAHFRRKKEEAPPTPGEHTETLWFRPNSQNQKPWAFPPPPPNSQSAALARFTEVQPYVPFRDLSVTDVPGSVTHALHLLFLWGVGWRWLVCGSGGCQRNYREGARSRRGKKARWLERVVNRFVPSQFRYEAADEVLRGFFIPGGPISGGTTASSSFS